MLVKTLDGFESKWMLDKAAATKRSGPHLKVRQFLKGLYPTVQILEEVQIQVKRNKDLYLDFYIPLYNIAIEIDGRQHREFTPFFSKNEINFASQRMNDKFKSDWCELNNISFIRLRDDEDEEEWKNKMTD